MAWQRVHDNIERDRTSIAGKVIPGEQGIFWLLLLSTSLNRPSGSLQVLCSDGTQFSFCHKLAQAEIAWKLHYLRADYIAPKQRTGVEALNKAPIGIADTSLFVAQRITFAHRDIAFSDCRQFPAIVWLLHFVMPGRRGPAKGVSQRIVMDKRTRLSHLASLSRSKEQIIVERQIAPIQFHGYASVSFSPGSSAASLLFTFFTYILASSLICSSTGLSIVSLSYNA